MLLKNVYRETIRLQFMQLTKALLVLIYKYDIEVIRKFHRPVI